MKARIMVVQCKNPNKDHHICKVCERAVEQKDKTNLYVPKDSRDVCVGFIYYSIKEDA